MNLDDVFGAMPQRPDGRDFWRLSQLILGMDGELEAAANDEEKDKAFRLRVGAWVDMDAITYMGMQRAFRALGVTTVGDLVRDQRKRDMAMKIAALYIEAFTLGCEYLDDSPRGPYDPQRGML
jgi:hypothetical protein